MFVGLIGSGGPPLRTIAVRVSALVCVAVLVLAVAVVGLGSQGQPTQPTQPIPAHRGLPDSPCPPGVSPAQEWCYAAAVPIPGAPTPFDVGVPSIVGGAPIIYVSVSDNAPMSGVPADDILSALHTTRSKWWS